MRVPDPLLGILLALCPLRATPPGDAAPALPTTPPILVAERSDPATRAEGLVARRTAVYPDGTVLATAGRLALRRARLDADRLAALLATAGAARLPDLPAIVDARADWFTLRDASWTLRWSGPGAGEVRIEGDLRPGSPDRALAPHGFVEVLEALESIPLPDEVPDGATSVEFEVEPWADGQRSPFDGIVDAGSVPWPAGAGTARAGRVRARGEAARDLAAAARAVRPVVGGGRAWRVRAMPIFPGELTPRAGAAADPRQ